MYSVFMNDIFFFVVVFAVVVVFQALQGKANVFVFFFPNSMQ